MAVTTIANVAPGDVEDAIHLIDHYLRYSLCKRREEASRYDFFRAISLAVRQSLMEGLYRTHDTYERENVKRLYYLSMEFLIGRSLGTNLINLQLMETFRAAAEHFHLRLEDIIEEEPDAALGNGGLGRLAACFLDSLATLDLPAYGYGINYEFGLFRQEIDNGYQKEQPDHWLSEESPWLIERSGTDLQVRVPLYGRVMHSIDRYGNYNPMWMDWKLLIGVPHDMLIPGFGGRNVNMLRLYSARASDEFDIGIFNQGDYITAVEQKVMSETISKVLYPSDSYEGGRKLRLIQEYFLVACALRDAIRRFERKNNDYQSFPDKVAIQLNDTHPALAVVELMRFLVDERNLPWEKAWQITEATCAYTNHTLLPEALEKWPVPLLEEVLPRHLQLIYEINRRFLKEVNTRYPGDGDRRRRMSIIEEGDPKQVRMAYLSIVGSHSVNGVAALHTELVKSQLVPDFYEYFPHKFNNKTNGVAHRRWICLANPGLTKLLTRAVGVCWIRDLYCLRNLTPFANDAGFQQDFLAVKRESKAHLAQYLRQVLKITVDPDSLFSIQVKRIHEYKRQLLNAMHIIHLYLRIVEDGETLARPRVFIFGGKAAPGYAAAKLIIKLINCVAETVNHDPRVRGQLRVAFVPDYRVSLAERIIPAADLSEQISTAGKEASGTGNMKFAMNGALTMGTLDGANVEILQEVGADNIYIFGLTAAEVAEMRRNHSYYPVELYHSNEVVRRVVDAIHTDKFNIDEPGIFKPIFENLMFHGDPYFHLADLNPYVDAQRRAAEDFEDRSNWARRAILNIARTGKFSGDRTIKEYATEIWNLKPAPAPEPEETV